MKQERSARRRERILDAAFSVFSRRGYRQAGVDEVGRQAETSKGGVYFHFPTKESLFLELLRDDGRPAGRQGRAHHRARRRSHRACRRGPAARCWACSPDTAPWRGCSSSTRSAPAPSSRPSCSGSTSASRAHRRAARCRGRRRASSNPSTRDVAGDGLVRGAQRGRDALAHGRGARPTRGHLSHAARHPAAQRGHPRGAHRRARRRMTVARGRHPPGRGGSMRAVELRPRVRRGTLVSAAVRSRAVDPVALLWRGRGRSGASLWLQPSRRRGLVGDRRGLGRATRERRGRFQRDLGGLAAAAGGAVVDAGDCAARGRAAAAGRLRLRRRARRPPTVWQGFEPACLVLPALLLSTTPEGSWLTASMARRHDGVPPATHDRLAADVGAAGRRTQVGPAGPARQSLTAAPRPNARAAAWRDSVARLAGAVGRGRLDKAVLLAAGRRWRRPRTSMSPACCGAWRTSAPESTLFAISRGPRTFVGATPERLVSLHGRELRTMAMAGSSAPRATMPAHGRRPRRRAAGAATRSARSTRSWWRCCARHWAR